MERINRPVLIADPNSPPSAQSRNFREIATYLYQGVNFEPAAAFLQAALLVEISATLSTIAANLSEK